MGLQLNGAVVLSHPAPSTERLELSMPPKNNRRCSVDGCGRPHVARGYCNRHYIRWKAYGDPLGLAPKPSDKERFLKKVDRSADCWLWTGAPNPDGYGHFGMGGKVYRAHRASYELFIGEIPEGLFVLHHCDNPQCVNPKHLYAGTQQQNVEDRESRHRGNQPKGERNGFAKLTEQDVREIRRRYQQGVIQTDLAERFGVSQHTISQVVRGERWKHVG